MKIAILGGGFTGLTASYYLAKKGHQVVLFEKKPVLGGLAVGFKAEGWDWYLERAIHHLFANDYDILNFAKKTGFEGIFFQEPQTASLYGKAGNYRIIPVDTPQDFLKFPYLDLPTKIRAGFILACLKFSPFLSFYERQTAETFLRQTMGDRAWEVLWQELFRKKFGKYAENILASFIWARISKRTKRLGYIRGGFQTFINHLEKETVGLNVKLRKGQSADTITKVRANFKINAENFDAVVSTLPTPVLVKMGQNVLPKNYLNNLGKIKYQHAISLILETNHPFLEKAYWLNMCIKDNAIMGLFQQTNFIDKKHYAGKHILYVGNYVDFEDPRIRMTDKEILAFYKPELKKINPSFDFSQAKSYVFKGPFAQPIFDKQFLQSKPDFITPVKNFYIANLDMTYPYDRGTNYAVKLGGQVSSLF